MEQKIREFDKWYEQYVDELFSYGMAFGMEKEYVLDVICLLYTSPSPRDS